MLDKNTNEANKSDQWLILMNKVQRAQQLHPNIEEQKRFMKQVVEHAQWNPSQMLQAMWQTRQISSDCNDHHEMQ